MKSELDWSNYRDQGMGDAYADIPKQGGDFAKAISVCIRSGVCEQQQTGVMCPSFRISSDPHLSPGGRVKLLKQILNQPDIESPVSDKTLDAAMDQCVACKGCQRECENNLDMALIKTEYLAQKLKNQRLSLRNRLFAYHPFLLHKYPWLSHLIRWRNRSSLLAYLGDKWLKIAASVPLPEVATRPFIANRTVYEPLAFRAGFSHSVVLWLDSFTTLFNPEQGEAALKLLRKAGYKVWLIDPRSSANETPLDSGRTLLSQGLVAEAREQAKRLLQALSPHIEKQRPIIGLEPSTLLMLRDEYQALGLGEIAAKAAKLAQLLEEFIAREKINGRFNLSFNSGKQHAPILVHGHCHQKAVGAMRSMRKALRLLPDLDVSFIKSSCCGMGGTFGLESEHIAQSQQMANLSLVPKIVAAPEADLVCNGFGCGQQIYAMTGRRPRHLANVLAEMIEDE
ncbi:(Fe-S)-binding protein [Corallincola holothuriorum]|uniref:(Fe-S)-binding protein n=1 Tax=Corallincola holothuriorum TaxID=2282215 RepID=A0A368NHH0_9GAMM|nr:(Fe-S)-binding protein [Corallincola holothuriorum]RCU50012.1 (Fe-S)-binding protein [Corallincola holothuriorum]